jgi:predicted DNA-binding transcriptional regulator AlpA
VLWALTFELTEGGHVMANDIGAAVQASKISTAQAATLAAQSDDDFVDIVEVESICGLSRSTIYRKLADPEDDFPRPVSLSLRRRKFIRGELKAWRARRMAARAGANATGAA